MQTTLSSSEDRVLNVRTECNFITTTKGQVVQCSLKNGLYVYMYAGFY